MNQGFPTALTFAIDTVLGNILQRHGAVPDMPMGANSPGSYVTGALWDSEVGADECGGTPIEVGVVSRWSTMPPMGEIVTEVSVEKPRPPRCDGLGKPVKQRVPAPTAQRGKVTAVPLPSANTWLTHEQCLQKLRELPLDWSQPLHPGKHTRDREDLSHDISHEEQAQGEYLYMLLSQLGLEENSKIAYMGGLRKFMVYLNRGYPLEAMSVEHMRLAVTGLFEPAVWKSSEIEQVLIDTVLHEAAVRGNAWSTVRTQMYGIRHHNISKGMPNPLSNKLRYDQLMRALKKFRGPKAGKHPATRAMLIALCKDLEWETDVDDLLEYAACLTAFHFMLRSAEYCARLKGGKFDLDKVIRLMDVKFFLKGVEITTELHLADEVEVTLGKQKCSLGGEKRRHSASPEARDLCIVRILALLVQKKGKAARHLPLFTWSRGSNRPGEGVRYHDVRRLAQRGAELCGRDTRLYATHSWRRGGASAYILAGCSLQSVQLYGRWALLSSLKLYVGPVIGQLLSGAQELVLSGKEEVRMLDRPQPRPRDFNLHRAKAAVKKLQEE